MQFADRMLNADDAARVQHAIDTDPEVRRRYIALLSTRDLSGPFAPIVNAPVPQHLVNIVFEYGRTEPAGAARASRKQEPWLDMLARMFGLQGGSFGWTPAVACGAVVAGVAIGWLAHDLGGSDVLAMRNGRLVATGMLAAALETAPSQQKIDVNAAKDDFVRLKLSFRNRAGDFCRQYEMAQPGRTSFAGIGCRDSQGTWHVEYNAPAQVSIDNKSRPVSGASTLNAVLDGMLDGDAFDAESERQHLQRKWAR